MAIPSPADEKSVIRAKMRDQLTRLSHAEQRTRSADVVRHLVDEISMAGYLAVFSALPGEPDLAQLHGAVPELRLLYPLVVGSSLTFHHVRDPASLQAGAYGIQEPRAGEHPEVEPDEIDGLLCPGLAFDRKGGRLGRGKGFYDRVLSSMRPDALRVGVGFALQVLDSLPLENHDVLMTHLVTEERLLKI